MYKHVYACQLWRWTDVKLSSQITSLLDEGGRNNNICQFSFHTGKLQVSWLISPAMASSNCELIGKRTEVYVLIFIIDVKHKKSIAVYSSKSTTLAIG